jgi:hypothetical protein
MWITNVLVLQTLKVAINAICVDYKLPMMLAFNNFHGFPMSLFYKRLK